MTKEKTVTIYTSVKEFLRIIDNSVLKLVVVCDENQKLIGVATEGDLRRYYLQFDHFPNTVGDFYNKAPHFEKNNSHITDGKAIFDLSRGGIPIVDGFGKFLGLKEGFTSKNSDRLKSVYCIAPTRISFAGGGSDLNSWSSNNRGRVVNLAINKYARVHIKRNYLKSLRIRSVNTMETLELPIANLSEYSQDRLALVIAVLKSISINEGFDIEIYCDFESGSGLGGSSSLVVALINAFTALYKVNLKDNDLVKLAYKIEREDAGILGGWQDYIPAVFGGLNIINFDSSGFKTYNLNISERSKHYLNTTLFISRIGTQRSSSAIHKMQANHRNTFSYHEKMSSIVKIADNCVDILGNTDYSQLGDILHKGWLLKKSLGDFISNQEIDERYEKFQNFGAEGGRLLGAGGSGFILVSVPVENQFKFINNCRKDNVPIERVEISTSGVRCVVN